MTAILGGNSFTIEDEIENLPATRSSPLMFCHHCNPGFPVLDGGNTRLHSEFSSDYCEIDVPVERSAWQFYRRPGPHTSLVDRCYYHRPVADAEGNVTLVLSRSAVDEESAGPTTELGLYFKYPQALMPQLMQWNHMVAGEYICGLEPGNAGMKGRQ